MPWFVWTGDPDRRPLLLVRRVVGNEPVGLFSVIDESAATRSFAAHRLRTLASASRLTAELPAAVFGAVQPDPTRPGLGIASLACVPVSYEQIGLHLGHRVFEQLQASTSRREAGGE